MAKGIKLTVTGAKMFVNADLEFDKVVKSSMLAIRKDLVKVSSSATPLDKGDLKDAHIERSINGGRGFTVEYSIFNEGFNYASWTHNADYNLGPRSRMRAVPKSKFAKGRLRVGKGYLYDVAEASKEGYQDYIDERILKALKSNMKKNKGK